MRGAKHRAMVSAMRSPLALITLASMVSIGLGSASAQVTDSSLTQPTSPQVQAILSQYEGAPTAEQLRAMGPDTLRVLISLYDSAQAPAYVRLRVLSAVRHFPTPATRAFLLAVLRVPNQSDLHQRQALLSLGSAFGDAARVDISRSLSSQHPVVREAAGRALHRIGTRAARRMIVEHSARERDPAVRRTFNEELRR